MRLLTLLLLTFLCTCVRAQNTRIDTIFGPEESYTEYRYIRVVPYNEMTKADLFMRGLRPGDATTGSFDLLDSTVYVRKSGVIIKDIPGKKRLTLPLPPTMPYLDEVTVTLEGRVGKSFVHEVKITNPKKEAVTLERTDGETALRTVRELFTVPAGGEDVLNVRLDLPRGSATHPLVLREGEQHRLEVRFVLIGYDICEQDFTLTKTEAAADPWVVPDGRETLYLRLKSTEKLMTIYKGGKVYSKVAVGRQLDELNLSGLGYGDYLLEVIDLGTGRKRYHGLRR